MLLFIKVRLNLNIYDNKMTEQYDSYNEKLKFVKNANVIMLEIVKG
jgi:hypothetical protein